MKLARVVRSKEWASGICLDLYGKKGGSMEPMEPWVNPPLLLVEEVVPLFRVPEALLSDRGANMLSHLMKEVCHLLGVRKLNTTAYHPQCDGMVERFNRTLKGMLKKHAARFGTQ